jgi:Cd2+/Zn2+-exporting ATPase
VSGFFKRYRSVLTSREFFITASTAAFVLSSAIVGLFESASLAATILSLAGVVVGGIPIMIGAVRGLIRREMNVDELVAIAIVASVIFKEYLSAGFVAFMMLFGKILEDFTAERAKTALADLGKLTPSETCVFREGKEMHVPTGQVLVGDTVVVRPGERISVDGVVTAGEASVNQAAITGESAPIAKAKGSEVYAGTLSELGALEIAATRVGGTTTIARIVDLVEKAEENRAPVVRVADRYARYFTPVILVTSAVVYVVTRNITSALAVLVVACPCALVMATPIAVIAGVASGARRGILIKGGARLEAAGRVTAIALDKTGTITLGEPMVIKVEGLDILTDRDILRLAAAAERLSEHPTARAIMDKARELGLEIGRAEEFHAVPGKGVIAKLDGLTIVVGTEKLLEEQCLACPPGMALAARRMEEQGLTPLMVATSRDPLGVIGIADTVRRDVSRAVNHLRQSGISKVVMLTGDSPEVARRVAASVGINEWKARLLPEQKVEIIMELQQHGHKVAMIGDGVNDAPALAQADVGVAMGMSGTDVAMETADIVLVKDDILAAADAIDLSRHTLRTIKQNLAFALVFNVIGISAAASGFLSPVGAALFHNVGSVAVVVNSARLVGYGRSFPR